MLNFVSIELKAIDSDSNIFRQYEVYVGRDLFHQWVLTTAYGRVGKVGQSKSYAFNTLDELAPKLKHVLQKRLTAKKRVGCNYEITHWHCVPGFEEREILELLEKPTSLSHHS